MCKKYNLTQPKSTVSLEILISFNVLQGIIKIQLLKQCIVLKTQNKETAYKSMHIPNLEDNSNAGILRLIILDKIRKSRKKMHT